MAINYQKVGWGSGVYVNPTNMNKMDNGIKAAADAVDAMGNTVNTKSVLVNASGNHGIDVNGASDKEATIALRHYLGPTIYMHVAENGKTQGLFSSGYYDDEFKSNGTFLIYRGSDGHVYAPDLMDWKVCAAIGRNTVEGWQTINVPSLENARELLFMAGTYGNTTVSITSTIGVFRSQISTGARVILASENRTHAQVYYVNNTTINVFMPSDGISTLRIYWR